jgi:aminoglycoside/choline kinase family phosphotransferase
MSAPETQAAKAPDERQLYAAEWAAGQLGLERVLLTPVSGDASFRRYFRFNAGDRSIVLMDAPPDKEDSAPFVDIAGRLRTAGLNAPEILEFDLEHGFGLLEDFGDTLYKDLVDEQSADQWFPGLLDVLSTLARQVDAEGLPEYDGGRLQAEMDLFADWYLGRHKHLALSGTDVETWRNLCSILLESAQAQRQVFVHKDFHSCNLLATPDGPGVIDFQDGLKGPVSYDLASLLWDRYVPWPRSRMEAWMTEAYERIAPGCSPEEWIRYCDLIGLQRNLKIVGIFARLHYRDHKSGYLEMIPRFYQYLLDVLPTYPEFADFQSLLGRPECVP